MAKSLTGTFTITDSMTISALGYSTATISIGSLIDVGDAQALEIEAVDYVWSNYDATNDNYEPFAASHPFTTDAGFGAQLLDRNSAIWLDPADNNVISSAAVSWDSQAVVTAASDFFPDDFQKTNGRFVVNDELYVVSCLTAGSLAASQELNLAIRIRAKVVKLTTRDWMAISLETVQNE